MDRHAMKGHIICV